MSNFVTYPTPPTAPDPSPMGFPDLSVEWRLVRETVRLGWSLPRLVRAPRGHGEPVLLIPGFQAPEVSMQPLRRLLRVRGYDAQHWGLGVNRGNVEGYVEQLAPRLRQLAHSHDSERVALVGWSLGGVVARELARENPTLVSSVVTYGSPVVGGPIYTAAARAYPDAERERIRTMVNERDRSQPIRTPVAAIFSRGDTIVSWPACIDRNNPGVTHFEVRSTHFSMGLDPSVWRVVLDQLAKGTRGESGAAARTSGSRRTAPAGAQS